MSFRTFVRTLTALLLMLALNGCGGGSGSGFDAGDGWGIRVDVSSQTLPVNLLDRDPCLGVTCFHTVQVDVTVTDQQGRAVPMGTQVSLGMSPGGHGYITKLNTEDTDRDNVDYFLGLINVGDELTVEDGWVLWRGTWVRAYWHELTAETGAGGIARFFFTSTDNPGDVTLTASVNGPTGAVPTRRTNVTVGSTAGTGMPSQALIYSDPDCISTQGLNWPSQSRLVAMVFDEKMGAVDDPDPGVNNVLIEIIDGPDAGEYLIGRNANGDIMRGNALLLPTRNGKAEFELVSGSDPGFVDILITADRSDNNVDNVISEPVVAWEYIVLSTDFCRVPPVPPELTIVTQELPGSRVGDTYAAVLEATGGVPPYTWAVTYGSLPLGVGMDPTGVISGSTNWPGNYCFIVEVTDNATVTARNRLCIEVTGERPPSALQISTSTLPKACVGESYARTLAASGGTRPYFWMLDYSPPAGADDWVTLSQSGVLYGTPELDDVGIYNLGLTVLDDGDQMVTGTLQLEVEDCP